MAAAALVALTYAILVPSLRHIHEGHQADTSLSDGSVGLNNVVANADGQLVAVGATIHGQSADNGIFRRSNGGAWTPTGSPEPGAKLTGIAVDGNITAVVGADHSGATVWTRTGTGTWSAAHPLPKAALLEAIAGRAGVFAVVGHSGALPVAAGGEGHRWTASVLPLPEGSTAGLVMSVIAGPTGFVAAGAADTAKGIRPVIWRSTDATSWTLVRLPFNDKAGPGRTNGFAAAVTVAGASTVVVGQVEGLPVAWLETSGMWTTTALPTTSAGSMAMAVVADPTGGFVAAGTVTELGDFQHGIAWTSADGRQWRSTEFPQATTGLRATVATRGGVALIGEHVAGHKGTPLVIAAPAATAD